MAVFRVREGLWRWTVAHPEWNGATDWPEVVGSVYCETPEAIVVVDPLVPGEGPDAERFWRAFDADVQRLGLPVVVVLTCRWHARSAASFRARHGARVFAPAFEGSGLDVVATDLVVDGGRVHTWGTGTRHRLARPQRGVHLHLDGPSCGRRR